MANASTRAQRPGCWLRATSRRSGDSARRPAWRLLLIDRAQARSAQGRRLVRPGGPILGQELRPVHRRPLEGGQGVRLHRGKVLSLACCLGQGAQPPDFLGLHPPAGAAQAVEVGARAGVVQGRGSCRPQPRMVAPVRGYGGGRGVRPAGAGRVQDGTDGPVLGDTHRHAQPQPLRLGAGVRLA
jgi:hypothetical protein